MSDIYIRVPVACPRCSRETLLPLPTEAIMDALEEAAPLRLSVPCHCEVWFASENETEQIREYLQATYAYVANDNQSARRSWIDGPPP